VPDEGTCKVETCSTSDIKLCAWWFLYFPFYKPGIDPRNFAKRTLLKELVVFF